MVTELWMFVVIGGPILLGIALLYAIFRNKTQPDQVSKAITERATGDLYERVNREDREG